MAKAGVVRIWAFTLAAFGSEVSQAQNMSKFVPH